MSVSLVYQVFLVRLRRLYMRNPRLTYQARTVPGSTLKRSAIAARPQKLAMAWP